MKTIIIKSPFWLGDIVFVTDGSKFDQIGFLVRKAVVKELIFSQKKNKILEYKVEFCDNHETMSCYLSELLNDEKHAQDLVDEINSCLEDYKNLVRSGYMPITVDNIINDYERNDKYEWHKVRVPDDNGNLHIKIGTMREIISWTENNLGNVVIFGKVKLKQYENNYIQISL